MHLLPPAPLSCPPSHGSSHATQPGLARLWTNHPEQVGPRDHAYNSANVVAHSQSFHSGACETRHWGPAHSPAARQETPGLSRCLHRLCSHGWTECKERLCLLTVPSPLPWPSGLPGVVPPGVAAGCTNRPGLWPSLVLQGSLFVPCGTSCPNWGSCWPSGRGRRGGAAWLHRQCMP